MKISTSSRKFNLIRAILVIFAIWFLLSLFNSPLVIPPIHVVFAKIIEILTTNKFVNDILMTIGRLVTAMIVSIVGGIGLGILCGLYLPKKIKETIKEMMKIFQIIPPVALLIMAIIWFGLNGIPAVFIVVASLIPLFTLQVSDAIDNIDNKLIEMGRVFNFSRKEMIKYIYVPSIEPVVSTAIIVSLTIGSKLIVMGEVLTTSTGVGGRIMIARLDIESETVVAWTIIIMAIYYLLEFLARIIRDVIKDRNRFEREANFE